MSVVRTILACFVGAAALIATPAHAETPPYLSAAIRAAVAASAIPVLLPARLPKSIGPIASVTVMSADRTGYYVAFSALRGCSGARSCAALHVAGYVRGSRAGQAYGRDRAVRLPDGKRGFYSPRDCSGTNCTEASLTFARGRFVYEIDANVAREGLPPLLAVYAELRSMGPLPRACQGR